MRYFMNTPENNQGDEPIIEPGDQGKEPVVPGEGGDQGDQGSGDPPQKTVKIGDVEYKPEQLTDFVKKAGQFDELQPEYTKVTQKLADIKKDVEDEARKKNLSPEEKDLNTAKGRALELLAPDIEQMIIKVVEKNNMNNSAQSRMTVLTKEIDGSDGRPKFIAKDIAKYAADNELSGDPEDIYERKFRAELRDFYRKQGVPAKKPVFTEKSKGGVHLPKGKDFRSMTREDTIKAGVEFLDALGS